MEDKQRVFIRGIEGRGNEVIATLVNLGAKDHLKFFKENLGNDPSNIYFIKHNGNISFVGVGSETSKIIMDYYKEIKLPEQWKDGDILFSENDNEFAVFKKWKTKSDKFLSYIAFYTWDERYFVLSNITKRDFRLATKREISQFYEHLHSHGQDWVAEEKKIVKYRWKPGMDEIFWVVSGNSHIVSYDWNNSPTDNEFFNFGNCFKTKEEAEAMAKKIRKLLNTES